MKGRIHHPWRWLLGFLLIGLVSGAVYTLSSSTPRIPIPQPDLSSAHPDVVQAIASAREQVREAPSSAQCWGRLAMILMAHHQHPDALICFREATRLEPRQGRWLYYSAILLEETNLEAAAAMYNEAAGRRPDYAPLRYRWAEVLTRLNRLDEAEQQFRKAAELAPRDSHPWIGLGQLANTRGDLQLARESLERAVSLAPWNRTAHTELAGIYYRLGEEELAHREQEQARQSPKSPGMPDRLLQDVEEWEMVGRQSANQADQLLARGQLGAAATAYQKLIQARPDLSRPRLKLAEVLHRHGNLHGSATIYRQVIQLFPKEALAYYGLGSILADLGDIEEAIENYHRCLELKPDDTRVHYALGLLREQQGNLEKAVKSYRSATESNPQFAPAQLALGVALQKLGDWDAAIEHIRIAVQLAPDDAVPQRYLERALKQRKAAESQGK